VSAFFRALPGYFEAFGSWWRIGCVVEEHWAFDVAQAIRRKYLGTRWEKYILSSRRGC
jgi:hypothetical protein